jgi:predicted  nucleic acid-binding Zn-ribbon protein
MILFKKRPNEYENLQKEIENLKSEIRAHNSAVDLKYMNWLEEKEIWIRELRDKIQKKVEYLNKREDALDMKAVLKNKMMAKLFGKSNRTLTDEEKKDLNIT